MSRSSTPASLLERLSDDGDDTAWSTFVQLYTPFIFHIGRRQGLNMEDASDIVQDVFVTLAKTMHTFRYDPNRSFRAFLRTVTENRIREVARRRGIRTVPWPEGGEGLEPTDSVDPMELYSDDEFRKFTIKRALQLMKAEFSPTTWQACWEHVVSGKTAVEVGGELGMTEGAVYAAKWRVLRRLREELADLWE